MSRQTILEAVAIERTKQESLYSEAQDDAHTLPDWLAIFVHLLGKASGNGNPDAVNPARFRKQMIEVMATAQAAAEAIDRRAPPDPLEPLYRLAQGLADKYDEPAIVLPAGHTMVDCVGKATTQNMACAVLRSRAQPEELPQAVWTAEPRGRKTV